jgi:hypothetical protein
MRNTRSKAARAIDYASPTGHPFQETASLLNAYLIHDSSNSRPIN